MEPKKSLRALVNDTSNLICFDTIQEVTLYVSTQSIKVSSDPRRPQRSPPIAFHSHQIVKEAIACGRSSTRQNVVGFPFPRLLARS